MIKELIKDILENPQQYLLIAASISFLATITASFISTINTLISNRYMITGKDRDAVRELVNVEVTEMVNLIYDYIGKLTIIGYKRESTETSTEYSASLDKYWRQTTDCKNRIKNLCKKNRVYIFNLYDSIWTISNAGDWMKGLKNNETLYGQMLRDLNKVRIKLDRVFMRARISGLKPSYLDIQRIKLMCFRLKYRYYSSNRESLVYKEYNLFEKFIGNVLII